MDFLKIAESLESYITGHRRYLHRHPELSDKEDNTVAYICKELEALGIRHVDVPFGGVFAFLGDEARGRTVLLRADIDALPVKESKLNAGGREKPVVSEVEGVAHACGHDCHAAMLLGAAKGLKSIEDEIPGRVILMFERGEEGGEGLGALLKYADDNKLKIDGSFGMHVDPSIPVGQFGWRSGNLMAGAMGFKMTITGKAAHGSQPYVGHSPIDAFNEYYAFMQSLRMKYASPFDPMVFSVGTVHAGTASNIIPPDLTFSGSFRLFNFDDGLKIKDKMMAAAEYIPSLYDCTGEMTISGPALCVYNDPACADLARTVVNETFGHDVKEILPLMASESFAITSKLWPGVFLRAGVRNEAMGRTALNHSECQDPDEGVLKLGCAMHMAYAMKFLSAGPDTADRVFSGDIKEFIHKYRPNAAKFFD